MLFGYLILIIAVIISSIAAWYSIAGLAAIFAAAVIPVMIMGGALEAGKIVATVWLHNNWKRAGVAFKLYLVPAIVFLMLLTSMGIFGFLSKAHGDQSLVSGDAMARVAIFDEKIKISKANIDANRRALKQMDEAVDQVMGRSSDEKGADKAIAIRRGQQKERVRLQSELAAEQKTISALSEERAPLAAEVRKVEADVGPIKYIAALIYSDNPDTNVLEHAVRWVIILIVIVFDPLAIILILAGIKQIELTKSEKKEKSDTILTVPEEKSNDDANNLYLAGLDGNAYGVPPMYIKSEPVQQSESEQQNESESGDTDQSIQDNLELLAELDAQREKIEATENILSSLGNDYQQLEEQHNISLSRNLKLQEKIDKLEEQLVETRLEVDTEVWYAARSDNLAEQVKNLLLENSRLLEERDLLFAAHSHEMVRADSLAIELELQSNRVNNSEMQIEPESVVESMSIVEPLAEPTVILPLEKPSVDFGLVFPANPKRGDMCMRVDFKPSRLFKWNSVKWIEVNKNSTDAYSYNEQYINFLAEKISSGEYSLDDLNELELQNIQSINKNTEF
jgi:hypothetical protein